MYEMIACRHLQWSLYNIFKTDVWSEQDTTMLFLCLTIQSNHLFEIHKCDSPDSCNAIS